MDISESKEKYIAAFDTQEYLEDYAQPDQEVLFTIRFMIQVLRQMPSDLLALEFGGGPVLYPAATMTPWARDNQYCDDLTANLDEVQRWLDNQPDAFDWRPHLKLILEEEGQTATPMAIARRMAELRRKVTRLSVCDALASAPVGQNSSQYDLLVALSCTDVAAATVSEWLQVMRNISSLVAPGGWLLISVTTGASSNTFEQQIFPCVDLSDEEICQGYIAAGCNLDTFRLDKLAVPTGREYSGLTLAIARKLTDSKSEAA